MYIIQVRTFHTDVLQCQWNPQNSRYGHDTCILALKIAIRPVGHTQVGCHLHVHVFHHQVTAFCCRCRGCERMAMQRDNFYQKGKV